MPFVDDPTISDDEQLLRRIRPDWFVPDYNLNRWRPSSAAFQNSPDKSPMSVHLTSVLNANNLSLDSVLLGHEGYGLARFQAQVARNLNQLIVRDPLPNDSAHALVTGEKTESRRRKL